MLNVKHGQLNLSKDPDRLSVTENHWQISKNYHIYVYIYTPQYKIINDTHQISRNLFLLRPRRQNNCLLRLDLDPGSDDTFRPRLHVPGDQLQPEREVLQMLHQPREEGRQPRLRNLLLL